MAHKMARPLFGYCLKRTADRQEAEDFAQEILFQMLKAVTSGASIENMEAYMWTIARYTWANWKRKRANAQEIVHDGNHLAEVLLDSQAEPLRRVLENDTYQMLQREIVYLSDLQRRIIIMYYYDGLKQRDIASTLHVPLGTVKWHLHEAKNEIRKGMEQMKESGALHFNHVELSNFGHSGSAVQRGETASFLRRSLTQNVYAAMYSKPKTLVQLAKELGTPLAFVTDEVQELCEYDFVHQVVKDQYRTHFIIWDMHEEQMKAVHDLYERAAATLADVHFEALMDVRPQIEQSGIYYPDDDYNFLGAH